MAIPGLKAEYETRDKVRIGEKRVARSGSSYPAATDYFNCPDPEVPDKAKSLRIVLPYAEVEECFSSGLEWWAKGKTATKSTLGCYTKGDGTAYRKESMLDPDDTITGPKMGQDRLPIVCRFRECPQFGHNCKPMARLVFFIAGGRTDQVLQIDTKSWNTIEALTATLQGARISGPLTGREFILSVAFQTKGDKRFPVLSLEEADVQINNDDDVRRAEGFMSIERVKANGGSEREQLAAYLDTVRPGWKDDSEVVDRILAVGVSDALAKVVAQFQ